MTEELLTGSSWHSYPEIFNLGHRALRELFADPVLVEEKIDGSQFSFGRFNGELRARSKGAVINTTLPEKMFSKAVENVGQLDLRDGWTYRSEYLQKPKHNVLAYERTPKLNVIIFDINSGDECYLSYTEKMAEAERLGLEVVPILYEGMITEQKFLLDFLERVSVLGGQKIEGFVMKNYSKFGPDKKALMGKYVSEQFKEVHAHEWREANPTTGDVIQRLIVGLKTPARWQKAVQHLREAGELTDSPKDIGALIKEVQADIRKECGQEIAEALVQYALPHILRGTIAGLPEWYKEQLMQRQFSEATQ